MIFYLVMGITFGFASAVQPGPMQTFLVSKALTHGWRHTLPLICAPVVSDIPIIALVLLILNAVPEWASHVLHLAGGIFLIYLALGALKTFRNYKMNQPVPLQSTTQNFFKAITVNLLNPNPYLAWSLILGPLLLQAWREASGHGIALAAGFYFSLVLTSAAIILAFAAIRRLGTRVSRILIGVSAAALAGFGIYQIWSGTAGLVAG